MSRITGVCLRAVALAGLLGSGLVAVVVPTASAATITVTTTADTVDGTDGETSLREAFATAGSNGADDTITLGAELTYTLTDCAGPLTHADGHELVVQGYYSTIAQSCDATGIIDSTNHAGRLELRNLVINGGPNTTNTGLEGAAVRSDSELLLENVEIQKVQSPGGSVVWSSFGHDITPYRLTISGGNLHHNIGSVVGCDNCSAQVIGATISDNIGSGLSLVDGYPVVIDGSTISNNSRAGVSNTGQGFPVNKMTIDNSQIQFNGRVGIRCVNPVFTGNTATGDGGGVKVGSAEMVIFEGGLFSENTAANGAGLDLEADGVSFDKATLNANKVAPATGTGGGARISATSATLLNSTVNGNTAAVGGGLNVTDSVELTHVTMADNNATTCGTIASDLVTSADPQLGPIVNGDPAGRLPAATSPLGGRVPVASCTVEQDQRLQQRPLGANCDAGSVEFAETVAPPSPDEALKDLIAEVKSLHLVKPLESSPVLKLELARTAVAKNQKPAAKVLLSGFITEVKAQSGQKIPAAGASQLVTKATAIRNSP